MRVCLIFLNFIVLHFLQIIYIMHTSCYYYFLVTAWKHSKKWCSLKIKVYTYTCSAAYVSLGWEGIGFQTIFVIFHFSSCIVNFGNGCKWSEAIPKMKNPNANESLGLTQAIKCNVGMLANMQNKYSISQQCVLHSLNLWLTGTDKNLTNKSIFRLIATRLLWLVMVVIMSCGTSYEKQPFLFPLSLIDQSMWHDTIVQNSGIQWSPGDYFQLILSQ